MNNFKSTIFILFFTLTISLVGCKKSVKESSYYDMLELPSNDSTITEGGIGKVLKGKETIDSFIKNKSHKIFECGSEGIEWNCYKTVSEDGIVIIGENVMGDSIISRLHTSSEYFSTKTGIKIGDKLIDVLRKEKVSFNLEEGILIPKLMTSKVSFSLDSITENKVYEDNFYLHEQIYKDSLAYITWFTI